MNQFEILCSKLIESVDNNTLYKLDVTWEFSDHSWIPLRDNSVIAYLYEVESETFKLVNAVTFKEFSPTDLFAESVDEIKGFDFTIDDPVYLLNHTISVIIFGD